MDDLVQRLTKKQDVEVSLRPKRTLEYFKAAVDRGYVHILFSKTETELGVRLDTAASDFKGADLEKGTGTCTISGVLILNYVRVRCVAEIDVAKLAGKGSLEIIEEVTPAQLAKERAARAAQ